MNSLQHQLKSGDLFHSKIGALIIKKFIGKGKSGYSYLAELDSSNVVLKLMHAEPNPYYSFSGNKVQLEYEAYTKLIQVGIRIPFLIEYDVAKNYIIKNYIEGETAARKIAGNKIYDEVIAQLFEFSDLLYKHKLNIDFFPTNFVIDETQSLFYIDYEINPYHSKWSLEEWGIYYWANSDGFRNFLVSKDPSSINSDIHKGIPIKKPFEAIVTAWKNRFS